MRAYFVKNLFFILSVNFLVKPIWIFFIDRTVQNRVGHSEYGTYQALFNLGFIFQILLDYGLNNYNTRTISRYPHKIRQLFPSILTTRLLLTLVYSLLVLGMGWILGYEGREMGLLVSVMLIQVFSSMVQFVRSNLAALQKFRLDGLISISDRLWMILIGGLLLYVLFPETGFRIEWFIWAQVFSYGITFILGLYLLRSLAPISFQLRIRPKRVFQVLASSTPFAILIFLMSIYTRADMTLIERLLGPEGNYHAGIYAAGYRLLDVCNTLGIMMSGLLLPLFGRLLAEKKPAGNLTGLALRLIFPLALCISLASIAFSQEIMDLLYTGSDAYAARVFAWVMAAFPAFCLIYIYSTLLTAQNLLKPMIILAAGALIINLGMNAVLIPLYQAEGAAIAAVATQYYVAFGSLFLSVRKSLVPVHRGLILRILAYLATLVLITVLVLYTPWPWMVQFFLLFATGVALIFVSRLLSPRSIRAFFMPGVKTP